MERCLKVRDQFPGEMCDWSDVAISPSIWATMVDELKSQCPEAADAVLLLVTLAVKQYRPCNKVVRTDGPGSPGSPASVMTKIDFATAECRLLVHADLMKRRDEVMMANESLLKRVNENDHLITTLKGAVRAQNGMRADAEKQLAIQQQTILNMGEIVRQLRQELDQMAKTAKRRTK